MSPETEHGFGTGLRAQLKRKQGEAEPQGVVELAVVDDEAADDGTFAEPDERSASPSACSTTRFR